MARRIYSEDLVLNLIVNGSEAKQGSAKMIVELNELEQKTMKLERELAKTELQIRGLSKSTAGYAEELKKLQLQKRGLLKQINENNAEMNRMRKEIGLSAMSINQLKYYMTSLQTTLGNTAATNTAALRKLHKEIQRVDDRLKQLRTGASRMSIAFERMGTVANKFGTIMSWFAITTFLVARAVGSTVRNLRELDSTFSMVMKTTGLTRQEMWQLKGVFDELNKPGDMRTPTSTKELLEIARIAGRLGVRGVEDVAAFTLAVDKLYVSLGTDLKGSVEEVAEKVGKLVNVFRLTDDLPLEEALLRAGSLINELGKSSAASAETVLNYTARLGGVGSMAKFTIDQLAGLGAALDAMNVPAERGSTALVKLITGLGQHAEKFARILGVTIDDYRTMLENDVNGVLLAMLEASAAGNESIMGVVESMGDMEVSGVRVAEVFGKLTQNIDFVREQQEIARVAFESSASVMNEYYIVSKDFNSLMALQGKRAKALADDYSRAVAPAVYKVYRGMLDLVESFVSLGKWILENSHLVKAFTALWIAFKSAAIVKAVNALWISIEVLTRTTWNNTRAKIANIAATNAMTVAYRAAGGGVKGLTAALRALWATLLANPFTAVLALLGAVAAALFLFRERTDAVAKAVAGLNTELDRETQMMRNNFEQVKRTNEATNERIRGIQLLNERYGQYLPRLISEKATLQDITKAQNAANEAMRESIALKWRDGEYEKIAQGYREKREKYMARFLSAVKEAGGATMVGQAKFELEELLEKNSMFRDLGYDDTANKLLVDFARRWKDVGLSIDAISKPLLRTAALYNEQKKSLQELDESTEGYLRNLRERGGRTLQELEQWQTMPEGVYESQKAAIEMEFDLRRSALQQRAIDERLGQEWLTAEILKAEEIKLRGLLALEEERFTKTREVLKDGVKEKEAILIGGEKDINDALIALNENLLKQMKEPKEARITKAEAEAWKNDIKRAFVEIEIEYQKAYFSGLMNKQTYDRLMMSLELEYKNALLKETRARGEETLELENEIWKLRISQQEKMTREAIQLQAAIRKVLNRPFSAEDDPGYDPEIDKFVDRIIAQRKRIRQFLGLEKDEEMEGMLKAFEVGDFVEQLRLLDEWRQNDFINHEEYERRKTDISREQLKERARITRELLGAVDGIMSAYSGLQRARMEQELDALGDNEAAKERVRMEYARKEKTLATSQALISGALAVMRILEGKISGNPLIDSIIKGVLIAATTVTTGLQVATIKAQQFATGNYPFGGAQGPGASAPLSHRGRVPVMGADDGRVYDAEWVGRPQTGIYRKPSLGLFAERPEMVIDWPTLRNIQFNNPALIDAILSYRSGAGSAERRAGSAERGAGSAERGAGRGVRQYARGSYGGDGGFGFAQPPGSGVGSQDRELQERLVAVLERLDRKKLVVYTELIKKDLDMLEDIEGRTGL